MENFYAEWRDPARSAGIDPEDGIPLRPPIELVRAMDGNPEPDLNCWVDSNLERALARLAPVAIGGEHDPVDVAPVRELVFAILQHVAFDYGQGILVKSVQECAEWVAANIRQRGPYFRDSLCFVLMCEAGIVSQRVALEALVGAAVAGGEFGRMLFHVEGDNAVDWYLARFIRKCARDCRMEWAGDKIAGAFYDSDDDVVEVLGYWKEQAPIHTDGAFVSHLDRQCFDAALEKYRASNREV